MSGQVETQVKQIIAAQARIEPDALAADMALDDLGLDSIGLVEMIFALEESFGVHVPFNANTPGSGSFDIKTVGRVVEGIQRLLDEQAA